MEIVALIIAGLIVGALGRLVVPGRTPMPIWLTILIGVVAVLVTGLILGAIGVDNWLVQILVGALIAAGIILLIGRGSATRRI